MVTVIDERVDKFIEALPEADQGRISGYLYLFKEYGFNLPNKYLKKLDKNLWELRPGNVRLLLGKVKSNMIIVSAFIKKTEKTPKKEIKIAKNRLREFEQ